MLLYLDTSALTTLVVEEPQTNALRSFLSTRGGHRLVTSALVRTELRRSVLRFAARPDVPVERAEAAALEASSLLRRLDLVRVGAGVLERAGHQPPAALPSLDAIHLATALELGEDLAAVVAYDSRLAAAALAAGLRVEAPTPPP